MATLFTYPKGHCLPMTAKVDRDWTRMPYYQMEKAQDDCCCVYIGTNDPFRPVVFFDTYNYEALPVEERNARLGEYHRFLDNDMEYFLDDILEIGQTVNMVFGFEQIYNHIAIHKDSESEFTVTQYGG